MENKNKIKQFFQNRFVKSSLLITIIATVIVASFFINRYNGVNKEALIEEITSYIESQSDLQYIEVTEEDRDEFGDFGNPGYLDPDSELIGLLIEEFFDAGNIDLVSVYLVGVEYGSDDTEFGLYLLEFDSEENLNDSISLLDLDDDYSDIKYYRRDEILIFIFDNGERSPSSYFRAITDILLDNEFVPII